jgi:uncharacterized repeat protein (TIGR03803 family)
MKSPLIVLTSVFLLLAPIARADSFSTGTNYLAKTNLTAANASFASAVAANPTDGEANVYYAMTRVLMLPTLSSGSSFLTALGFSSTGRNVYDWTAAPRKRPKGGLAIPSGLNADAFTAQFRGNVLPALAAAQTNLAQITDTSFTLTLPQEVTHLPTVTIDYGDVLMLRAMLNSAELFIYGLNSLNVNAQITSVSNIIAKNKSIEAVLAGFPSLLTFATTSDKGLAQAAFTNAASQYFAASYFIRNVRAPGATYLFNLGASEEADELKFRQTLSNLVLSVSGPAQPLPMATNISISMGALFSETNSPRQWLPQFQSQGAVFIWDSWTNVTLGGVAQGLTKTNLDKAVRKLGLEAWLETPGVTLAVLSSMPDDGGNPNGVIRGKDGNLYGTTQWGGNNYNGNIFKVTPSGVMTTLYEFGSDANADQNAYTPNALIQASDGYLYGTAQYGGANYSGTIFRISTNGGAGTFKTLYSFGTEQNDVGYTPVAALMQAANGNLYGTTYGGNGGNYNPGTIFRFSPNSSAFSNLYAFSVSDGANPASPLIQGTDGNLYGVTSGGGSNNNGTVFEISTDGGNFASLYSFGTAQDGYGWQPTGLAQGTDGRFYGTTQQGGNNDYGDGTLFGLSVSNWIGTLTMSYSFDHQNQDGYYPIGSLVPLAGGKFYGVTASGGANNRGSIFAFAPHAGAGSMVWFTKNTGDYDNSYNNEYNNYQPPGLFAGADGNYYGTTSDGGNNGNGTVYKLSISSSGGLTAPSVTPASQSVKVGGAAIFSIKETNTTLTYQWLFNNAPLTDIWNISGSATTQLTISPAMSTNAGSYSVIVSNSVTSVTSKPATLQVAAETTSPSVTIVFPKTGSRTGAVAFNGTASDSVRVAGVEYWIYPSKGAVAPIIGWASLSAGKGSSNWTIQTAPLSLPPGTNILSVKSSNYSGLFSPAQSATFFYQTPATLQLQASPAGMGTFTGAASVKGDPAPSNGASLYVGESYTVTAKPAKNWWLTNWLTNGVFAGTNTTLSFVMEPGLSVTANFATNQFVGMAGRYDGIFYPSTQPATETNSGLIENLVLKTNGIYSGKLYLASGTPYALAGAFDESGYASETIARSAAQGGNVTLELNIQWQSSPRQITGLVQGGSWISSNLNLFAATTNLNNATNYTMLLPQDMTVTNSPPNYGYAQITNTGSMINIGGALSDGAPFFRSEPINEENQFPVYASLYNNTGLLLGELSLDAATNSAIPAGALIWFKPTQKTGLYTNEFTTSLDAAISVWTNSASALAVFTNNTELVFSGGGLASSLTNVVQLTSSNTLKVVTNANFSSGSINLKNGLLTVTFTNAIGKKITAYGTVLQNFSLGGGFFLGATNAGTITLGYQTSGFDQYLTQVISMLLQEAAGGPPPP